MVILAVDSTARPFECDIGEKPNILAGYREFNPRVRRRCALSRRYASQACAAAKEAPCGPF
jgi:hypothetical protein